MYNLIQFVVLALQVLAALSSTDELKYPRDCGWTPMHPMGLIVGGHIVNPDEYSWMASLDYGNKQSSGVCGGSVINSWYVLTAAHCVTGPAVDQLGGLTGLRLGNFTQEPYCDYGTSSCSSYLHFGIAEKILHWNYTRHGIMHNDIALLRVDRMIPLNNILKPVCLPNVNISEPEVNTILTVAGWGKTGDEIESVAKRAVAAPLISDPSVCEFADQSRLCAGVLSQRLQAGRSMCAGDSGGPVMYQWQKRTMVIEGIISFVHGGNCINSFFPTHYTRVRHYLNWIDENMFRGNDSPRTPTVEDRKFPTNCGCMSTPIDGTNNAYSWLITLNYGRQHSHEHCVGSVINSLYVLTSAYCVSLKTRGGEVLTPRTVRVRDYDENVNTCKNRRKACVRHQELGIEKIITHSVNDIALIRLNRPIQFGPKMKPICLPFGGNHIPEPLLNSNLVVSKRNGDANVTLSEISSCRISTPANLCTVEYNRYSCGAQGLLMNQFENRRMVLEGINSNHSTRCFTNRYSVFTHIRSYGDWLSQNMKM